MRSATGSTFLCHACADRRGLLKGLHLVGTNPSTYQIDKARKHAGPTSSYPGVNSVSASTSSHSAGRREWQVSSEAIGSRRARHPELTLAVAKTNARSSHRVGTFNLR
jgi:hypothetical protein